MNSGDPSSSSSSSTTSGATSLEEVESNHVFKLQSYWEGRFKKEESYEWLVSWKTVENLLLPYLHPTDRILVVGCGNSPFSADLYDAGFHQITNIDFASSVIERMQTIHETIRPEMKWMVMDMTDLTFPNESFDVVIDKAAMDALVVDEGDVWEPEQNVVEIVDTMCLTTTRVLKKDGLFLQISFAQPHFRTKYLMGLWAEKKESSPYQKYSGLAERYGWSLSHEVVETEGGCLNSFLYIMKKTG
eukprot:gene712-774_t